MKKIFMLLLVLSPMTLLLMSCQPEQDDNLDKQPTARRYFDGKLVPEISGLAFSRQISDRLYVHNDSGDSSRFFYGSTQGSDLKEVKLNGVGHTDYEDMDLGPCGDRDCLYIGDIGDNAGWRKKIQLIMIVEEEEFSPKVTPLKMVNLTYPDGKGRNAESMAVHPLTGDVIIVTKDSDKSEVYRLKAETLNSAASNSTLKLAYLGEINMELIFKGSENTMTAMSISPDGERFVLLNYADAFEFPVNLSTVDSISTSMLKNLEAYRYVMNTPFPQQEAIAYDPFDGQIYFTTEVGGDDPAPLWPVFNQQSMDE